MPTVPDHFVRRQRLLELLDDLAPYPVTAIVAPAGAGKTALAADWVRRCGRPSAWLALDEADREPAQLWAALMAAIDQLAPGVADRASRLLDGSKGLDVAIHALCDDLELADVEPGVLVLDDVHHVDGDERTSSAFATFVQHRPAWIHLLLLSRRRLPLPVDRLRAAGILADVDFDSLRFLDDEAVAMLARLCPDAPAELLPRLAGRAGGWAAALQLAALSVRSQRGKRFSAAGTDAPSTVQADRLVDEYVWREVLHTERAELIGLLLSTAVVDRVNYGLAEALTGRPDAGDLLSTAESRGLFVTSLDAGGWFEVHSLVRDMLLAEFARRSPAGLHEQHARAAHWFESVGEESTALDHWLLADRPREALRLLTETAARLSEAGRSTMIGRVLDALPPEVTSADLDALIQFAWCRMHVDRAGFLDALAAAESAVDEIGADPARTHARLGILRSTAAFMGGDWLACEHLARQALAEFGEQVWQDPIGRFGWSLVAHGIALGERWNDSGAAVGEARIAVSNDPGRRIAFEGTRAVGLALAGNPLDELQAAAGVRHLVDAAGLGTLRTELSLADAIVAREVGDRQRAEDVLETLAGQSRNANSVVQLLAQLELAEMQVDEGRLQAAEGTFQRAQETCRRQHGGRDAGTAGSVSRLARAGVHLHLAKDQPAAAAQWTRRVDDPFWRPLCEAKLHLAEGRPADAAEAVARAEPRCVRHHVVWELVLARAIVEDDRDASAKSVALAVEVAAEHGMLQSVATEGAAVMELVELAAWTVPDGWMDRLRRALVPSWEARAPGDRLIDELTDRERDVLRLLPSRLSLREIASELFVSQNTLKFHLRIIYRKLGVNSRAEAVATARRMRLLPRTMAS